MALWKCVCSSTENKTDQTCALFSIFLTLNTVASWNQYRRARLSSIARYILSQNR